MLSMALRNLSMALRNLSMALRNLSMALRNLSMALTRSIYGTYGWQPGNWASSFYNSLSY